MSDNMITFSPANEYVGQVLQEMYGWTNNSQFYTNCAPAMLPFFRMVQQWEQWCTGIVPTFHAFTNGVVPTHLAKVIVDKVSALIYGGGVFFASQGEKFDKDGSNDALRFISEIWARKCGFKNVLQDGIRMHAMLGTAALKLNADESNDLWVEAVPFSRMYLSMDAKGDVIGVRTFIRPYTNGKNDNNGFILCEERFYEDDEEGNRRAYSVNRIYRTGLMVNQFAADNGGASIRWEALPYAVKKALKADYATIRIEEPVMMPFDNLGVFLLRFTPSVSRMPHLKYGDSVIEGVIGELCKYDILSAQFTTETYVSRARVFAKKQISNPQANGMNVNTGIDSFLLTQYEGVGMDDKGLTVMQPDIRAEAIAKMRNVTLENIATAIGISPSSFAPYLQDSSNRTAREVSAEESATALFVENHRDLIKGPIDDLLRTVCRYYSEKTGLDDVVIQFSKAGQSNYTLLTDNVAKLRNAGLISIERAVSEINPGMDQAQLIKEVALIKKEDEEKREREEAAFGGVPDFGGGIAEEDGEAMIDDEASGSEI